MQNDNISKAGRTRVLIIIVLSQFACISLWFAGNSVIEDLVKEFGMDMKAVGHLVSMVQFGFITGTLIFAITAIADRFSPSRVFLFCSIVAAMCSSILILSKGSLFLMYGSRYLTGFFLAGIYPVGMKIASDYFSKDLSKALGFLVGALVIGTAFPHFISFMQTTLSWKSVLISTSILSVAGGILVITFIPDGPYRVMGVRFHWKGFLRVFREKNFRSAAFGYFGHMWELYAFWTFVPVILYRLNAPGNYGREVSLQSFAIIGIGGLACVIGGILARRFGSYYVAFIALALSGFCCFISPLILSSFPFLVFGFLLFWGMVVVMDSPQFSTLVAGFAPPDYKGTALTIVNCIGFSITILSIQALTMLMSIFPTEYIFIFLLPGPVLGLLAMHHFKDSQVGQAEPII